ncbi:MAG: IS110 family transposase [Dehalococcoidales bacterium]|nr:IS110 family transposase [Dehalococcoidales bacterium]
MEDADIKLAGVATDIFGLSGKKMLQALLDGNTNAKEIATLAKGKLRKKIPELIEALNGNISEHHRFLIGMSLRHLDDLAEMMTELDERIDKAMKPYRQQEDLLTTITGIDKKSAEIIIAEIGADMSQFPTAAHLASWAGICPGNNESAGKRRSGKINKGDSWLMRILIQVAFAAARTKNTYLKDKYHRIAARRGPKKAAIAIGHKILTFAYYVLSRELSYQDLGENYLDNLNKEVVEKRLIKRLQELGNRVTIEPVPSIT